MLAFILLLYLESLYLSAPYLNQCILLKKPE